MIEQRNRQRHHRDRDEEGRAGPFDDFHESAQDEIDAGGGEDANPVGLIHHGDHPALFILGRTRLHEDLQRHREQTG
jgi:hypothetical protein